MTPTAASAATIHQFAPALALGDGVSNAACFIGRLLRRLGYRSSLHACHYPSELDEVQPAARLAADAADLVLVHHSMGHEHEDLIEGIEAPIVLVYHNITPAEFFAPHSPEHRYAVKGRVALARWARRCAGAIGLSPLNSQELLALGYRNVATLPLLVDLERLAGGQARAPRGWSLDPSRPLLLSVGRLVENKRQHLLIDALWYLRRIRPRQPRPLLLLPGGTTSPGYVAMLRARGARLDLAGDVLLPGKCSDEELLWLYRHAACYWCASAHEGFCMPLIEASYHDLPAIAVATSNIPATLGEAGLLLRDADPRALAAATAEVLDDAALRRQLAGARQRHLERFAAARLLPALGDYLRLFVNPSQPH